MAGKDSDKLQTKPSRTMSQTIDSGSPTSLDGPDGGRYSTPPAPPESSASTEGRGQLWQAVRTVVQAQRNAAPIQPISREGEISLSFGQERLWLLNQLEPDSAAYNRYLAYHISGPLDLAALEQSLDELARRHETLRTGFYLRRRPFGPAGRSDANRAAGPDRPPGAFQSGAGRRSPAAGHQRGSTPLQPGSRPVTACNPGAVG